MDNRITSKFLYSRSTDFPKQRRVSTSPYYPSSWNNSYRSFSRSKSRNRGCFTNYNSSHQHPSRPRSRFVSAFRRFVSAWHSNSSENPNHRPVNFPDPTDNVEIKMETTEMTNSIIRTSSFFNLYIRSEIETYSNLFSKTWIFFYWVVVYISVLIIPNFFDDYSNVQCFLQNQHDTAKTETIANRSQVLVKKYLSVIWFQSNETLPRSLINLFVVADIKWIFLGVTVFEKILHKFNIQDFTMCFKPSWKDQRAIASFTKLIEKIFPFFSLIYQISSQNQQILKPII